MFISDTCASGLMVVRAGKVRNALVERVLFAEAWNKISLRCLALRLRLHTVGSIYTCRTDCTRIRHWELDLATCGTVLRAQVLGTSQVPANTRPVRGERRSGACSHACVYTRTDSQRGMHKHTARQYVHARIYDVHTYTHAYIYTHTHTHTHTHT